MPCLRQHAKDPIFGAISQRNLERIAELLERHARRLKHPIFGWFSKDRGEALEVGLLAATFSRVKGIPEPLPAQFDAQVRIAMEREGL